MLANDLLELPEALAHFQECRHFFDLQTKVIGRVVSSEKEPAGSYSFYIWADESAKSLDIGHIVIATSEEAVVIGVLDEPRRFSDLRSFLDDFYDRSLENGLNDLIEEPPTSRPEILVFKVNVLATKHLRDDVESHRPPISGPVFYATKQAIEFALDGENFTGTAIPALLHTNGNIERDDALKPVLNDREQELFQQTPIWLDEDYLLGPEAGHANWTGQSGLATKTSHALFLTSATFQCLKAEKKTVAALMFNVKGPDLLWLDKPAQPDDGLKEIYADAGFNGLTRQDLLAYKVLGLHHDPFSTFRVFAPFRPGMEPRLGGNYSTELVRLETEKYQPRLNTLRNAPAEALNVFPILWELRPFLYQAHKVFERNDLDDKLFGLISEIRDDRNIMSLQQLNKLFDEIDRELDTTGGSDWHGHHKFTIKKARNRFNGLPSKFAGLLTDGRVAYGNLPRVEDPFVDQELRVVDIASCNTNVQELIVSAVINEIWKMAEQSALGVSKVIVFVDELNKYAASGSEGALRNTLVDIAARGRHLNVVLFGAQQFRSKVDDEILGNCGTSFYGRVGDEEITNSSYRSLSETTKQELLGLRKGKLLVRHAHFRSPLFGAFPKPPTVPGIVGQRVFNDRHDDLNGVRHSGEVLFLLMKRLMGDHAPRRSDVLTASDGVPEEYLIQITSRVERDWERMRETTAANRLTPWKLASTALTEYRRSRS